MKDPKLIPLIEQAWELLLKVKDRQEKIDKQIAKMDKEE